MISQKRILLLLGLLLIGTLACNIPGCSNVAPSEVNIDSIATSVALTLEASGQKPPPSAVLPSPFPQTINTPENTPTATFTPTITLTPTPPIPVASVSEDTNCRTGPDKVYDYIGALLIGEKAEVVGKNTSTNYWIIKNPDTNGTCWLWGYYATIAGNTANLQEYAIPPTPTPMPTSTPTIPIAPSNITPVLKSCGATMQVTVTWADNSDNENGFFIYLDDVQQYALAINQTEDNIDTAYVPAQPITFGVSAFNGTGESAVITAQATCP